RIAVFDVAQVIARLIQFPRDRYLQGQVRAEAGDGGKTPIAVGRLLGKLRIGGLINGETNLPREPKHGRDYTSVRSGAEGLRQRREHSQNAAASTSNNHLIPLTISRCLTYSYCG